MARKRLLDPGFFTDSDLLALSPLHRLLFAGLWGLADREGRLQDKPLELKIRLLPADACDVDVMLNDLARSGRVVRYAVGGRRYLAIPNFRRHQNPHPKEPASVIPPPPDVPSGGQNGPNGVDDGGAVERHGSGPEHEAKTTAPPPSHEPKPVHGWGQNPAVTVAVTGSSETDPESVTESDTSSGVGRPSPQLAEVVVEKVCVADPVDGTPVMREQTVVTWVPTADGCWEAIQLWRGLYGLPRERTKPRGFDEWFAQQLLAVGAQGIVRALLRFLTDRGIRAFGKPTAVFITPGMFDLRAGPHLDA